MNINSNPSITSSLSTLNAPLNAAGCSSTGTPAAAKLRASLQQLQAQTPQEFQAILSQLTGQMPQNAGSQSQGILNWL